MAKKDGVPKLLMLAAQLLLSLIILAALFYFADAAAVFSAIMSGRLEFFAYACSDSGNYGPYLFVGERFIQPRFFYVQDLPF